MFFIWLTNTERLFLQSRGFMDVTPPICSLEKLTYSCNRSEPCEGSSWAIEFGVIDTDGGLFAIRTGPNGSSESLQVDSYAVGSQVSVKGNLSVSCCYVNASISVFDRYGNGGACVFKSDGTVIQGYAQDLTPYVVLLIGLAGLVGLVWLRKQLFTVPDKTSGKQKRKQKSV